MSTTSVKTGLWADYTKSSINRHQLLLSDYWTGILTNALAVLITSSSSPIFSLLITPLSNLHRKLSRRKTAQDQLEETRSFGDSMGHILYNLRHAGGGYVNIPLANPPASRARETLGTGIMLLILACLPILLIVASIVSAGLASDSVALSRADACGFYEYRPDSARCSVKFLEFERRAEMEAGFYALNCYGSSTNVDRCTRLYNQSISYLAGRNVECPFAGEVCVGGRKPAWQVSTGLVSGTVLGINARNPFLFNRTMTCAPVISDERYVKTSRFSKGFEQWEYWYGPSLSNYTWANPVQESPWDLKGYSASVHCSAPGSARGTFVPVHELQAGPYPVTLMFISSHNIMYPHPRQDPIFPAQTRAQFQHGYAGPPMYIHNTTQATVLGCKDEIRICKSTTGPCWTNENITSITQTPESRTATEEENVIKLLRQALDYSTACGSTQFRGAEALDAQTKIAHMQSQDLAPEQWKVEVEKFFQTSLARIQLNVYDIARGTAAAYDGYRDVLPARHRGICDLVAIPTVGWKNLNVAGLVGTVFGVAVLWVISRRMRAQKGGEVLVAVLLWRGYLSVMCFLWTKLIFVVTLGFRFLRRLFT